MIQIHYIFPHSSNNFHLPTHDLPAIRQRVPLYRNGRKPITMRVRIAGVVVCFDVEIAWTQNCWFVLSVVLWFQPSRRGRGSLVALRGWRLLSEEVISIVCLNGTVANEYNMDEVGIMSGRPGNSRIYNIAVSQTLATLCQHLPKNISSNQLCLASAFAT